MGEGKDFDAYNDKDDNGYKSYNDGLKDEEDYDQEDEDDDKDEGEEE